MKLPVYVLRESQLHLKGFREVQESDIILDTESDSGTPRKEWVTMPLRESDTVSDTVEDGKGQLREAYKRIKPKATEKEIETFVNGR